MGIILFFWGAVFNLFFFLISIFLFTTIIEESDRMLPAIRNAFKRKAVCQTVHAVTGHPPESDTQEESIASDTDNEVRDALCDEPPDETYTGDNVPKDNIRAGEAPFIPITVADDEEIPPPQVHSSIEWEEYPSDDADVIKDERESRMLQNAAEDFLARQMAEQEIYQCSSLYLGA